MMAWWDYVCVHMLTTESSTIKGEFVQKQTGDSDQGGQGQSAIVALRENRPNPKTFVWYQPPEVTPDGEWTVPHESDFSSMPPQPMWDDIQKQTDDSEQEVGVILTRHNENSDHGGQGRRAIVALRENRPNPNKVVWYQKHEVMPDGEYYLPDECDFVSMHDIMPTGRMLSTDVDHYQNAFNLHTDLNKDVSSVIAAYSQSPVGRVALVSNGMTLFSETVHSFPHTGTFASVLPVFQSQHQAYVR
jgi:hypothetical protein